MDRLFLIQKEYVEDQYNIEEIALFKLIKLYSARNLDSYYLVDKDSLKAHIQMNKNLEHPKKIVPVGNLNFVRKTLETECNNGNITMNPIEIPEVLYKYTNRFYTKLKGKELKERFRTSNYFIKDIDTLKNWNNLLYLGSRVDQYIDDNINYSVSELLDIQSEFRVFVFNDEVKACNYYLGNNLAFPDRETILDMISSYEEDINRPKAYTLDVAVVRKDDLLITVPLEVHAFVACGLYGFYDECLLNMLDKGYEYYVRENNKKILEKSIDKIKGVC